ncbi:MAG TPA: hypothetical protein VJ023_21930 [Pyrinomonadaceae bacterium]|nr:hypothetical protein [Pyrinomonadaceae bacterium]
MSSIINDALVMLSDLELNLNDLAKKLSPDEGRRLAANIDQVARKLGELNSADALTELEFAEMANELINAVNSSELVRETLSADEEISSMQERAAQLAVLEKKQQNSTSTTKSIESDKREKEQFEFLSNQIINRCQIIRKKLDQMSGEL